MSASAVGVARLTRAQTEGDSVRKASAGQTLRFLRMFEEKPVASVPGTDK